MLHRTRTGAFFRHKASVQPRGALMLAYVNVAVLSLWLLAELVPLLADNLANMEARIGSGKVSRKDD